MNQIPKNSYAVIMAGGSGTRLWPLSRRELPKQMQNFVGDKALINETVERLLGVMGPKQIYVSTTMNYAPKIKGLLPQIPEENIIIEPASRGTTAAFALVVMTIMTRNPEAVIFTIASDHSVTNVEQFHKNIFTAFKHVSANPKDIALIGIKPTEPDTSLGYIKTAGVADEENGIHLVEKFVEKPDKELAEIYANSNDHYWNTAYYCFKADTLLNAYKDADPEINGAVGRYLSTGNAEHYMNAPIKKHEIEIIDAAKHRLVMVPGDFNWKDIGSWQGLHEVLTGMEGRDLVSNSDSHVDINSKDCLVLSNGKKLVATVNLDNIVIVDTDDALLVMNKNNSQDVKKLLEILKEKGMSDYL